jgi:hypothetical protein
MASPLRRRRPVVPVRGVAGLTSLARRRWAHLGRHCTMQSSPESSAPGGGGATPCKCTCGALARSLRCMTAATGRRPPGDARCAPFRAVRAFPPRARAAPFWSGDLRFPPSQVAARSSSAVGCGSARLPRGPGRRHRG